jgi:predicted PurR-regulated permease PerM
VNDASTVWLGVIGVSVAVMALIQVAVIVAAAYFAKQAANAAKEIRRDLKPILEKANRIADDAARATALATAQVERVDRLINDTAQQISDGLTLVQSALITPLRQGSTMIAAARAIFTLVRGWQGRGAGRRDDDDALFVG